MDRNKLSVLLLVFTIYQIVASSNDSDTLCSRCQCLNRLGEPFSVDCDNLNFDEVPAIWKDLQTPWSLSLNGNYITRISKFISLNNLTLLSFKYNQVSTIENSAFEDLINLESLILSHNNITEDTLSEGTFRGQYQDKLPYPMPLKRLDLSNNYIRKLPKGVFLHLPNLTYLDLSHNPFVDLSLKTAEAFTELALLQFLDLSYTKLQRLPNHFFAELTNLEHLDLSGNLFPYLPAEINYARSLRSLNLIDNVFGIITANSFWENLNKLETLILSNSKTLFMIENEAFGNLTSLQTLWLNDNTQLSAILPRAFSDANNHTLHLKTLHLENNDLETLSETALPWKEIQYLNLQGNPWNCDCNFEWMAKGVIPELQKTWMELTIDVTCAAPPELMGLRMTDDRVQSHDFVCQPLDLRIGRFSFIVIATIIVGTLLLVTGSVIFSYVLFRRAKVTDWIGGNVKYRRTEIEDEEAISSNLYY